MRIASSRATYLPHLRASPTIECISTLHARQRLCKTKQHAPNCRDGYHNEHGTVAHPMCGPRLRIRETKTHSNGLERGTLRQCAHTATDPAAHISPNVGCGTMIAV